MNTDKDSQKYILLPNNMVQNITIKNADSSEVTKPSFIQLYGKKTVAYFSKLLELQNIREEINFSVGMILWKIDIKDNMARERNYFRDFLVEINKNSLITFASDIDLKNLSVNDFLVAKLNIFDFEKNKEGRPKRVKYFTLYDYEYSKIINDYTGKLDRYNLLNLFCNIKSRIYRNREDVSITERMPEVCYPSYETIMDDIFIESDKTLSQYIDELVKLDLIRCKCAGDMFMKIEGEKPIRRKANNTYALFSDFCQDDLKNAINMYRSQKESSGWIFLSKEKEFEADEKRKITQKINWLEKVSKDKILTQSQKKELAKLKKKQEQWKKEYDNKANVRELEEKKLMSENPGKKISEIYEEKGLYDKADRAYEEEVDDDEIEENKYDIKSLIDFLSETSIEHTSLGKKVVVKQSPYLDYVDVIARREMTIKQFFENIYPDATYNAFLKFKELKSVKKVDEIDVLDIGPEDIWGDTEDYDTTDLQDYLGVKYYKYCSLVEKIENRELSLQEFFDKHYTFGTYGDFKEFQEQPF